MKPARLTGIGQPAAVGKHALFQPPVPGEYLEDQPPTRNDRGDAVPPTNSAKRVRTTIDLTGEALQTIQQVQQEHRLKTGKVLPLWKAVSLAIMAYGKDTKE